MCIAVFLWQSHPLYPFFLLLNRDEYHSRATEALGWWEGGEILGGRDGLAGGTWLASGRDGRLAFVTNVRELSVLPLAKSRGDLPVRFLESKKSPLEFAEEIVEEAHQFNGFNLILADICSKTMVYVTNRPEEEQKFVTKVLPGIHVLANANLDTPWPKAKRLGDGFNEFLDKYGDGELPYKEMVEKLMTNRIRDDISLLPRIYTPEKEHCLSSIFVDADTPLGRYGTRSTSALFATTNGEVSFYEKHLDMENEQWKERIITYEINKEEETEPNDKTLK
ncbi:transport and Golgi organization protein 2 homolog [Morus notabilis]|uniref:transport and Golgi organization protein 2 homolog n=1 Tax=Morus notabilis TaxID=981085 RepID=UPI000CED63FD|nr:transport and Golgi organization protein 2 homolog [Morus notabilis]